MGGLVDFQPYGRGVVFGNPLPPDLCGGRLVLRVSLVPDANPSLSLDDLLPDRRTAAERRGGIRLVVPGVVNFNDVVTGENVYIKQ